MEQIYDRLEDAQIQDNDFIIDLLLQEDIPLSQQDNLDFNENYDWLDEMLRQMYEQPDESDDEDILEPYTLPEIETNSYIHQIEEGVDPYEEIEASHTFYNLF
jgi:hypothetical protein